MFEAILLGSLFFTWENIFSLIPFVATSLVTWGIWQDDMKLMRKAFFISQIGMFIYDLLASLYVGALVQICNLIPTAIAIYNCDLFASGNRSK